MVPVLTGFRGLALHLRTSSFVRIAAMRVNAQIALLAVVVVLPGAAGLGAGLAFTGSAGAALLQSRAGSVPPGTYSGVLTLTGAGLTFSGDWSMSVDGSGHVSGEASMTANVAGGFSETEHLSWAGAVQGTDAVVEQTCGITSSIGNLACPSSQVSWPLDEFLTCGAHTTAVAGLTYTFAVTRSPRCNVQAPTTSTSASISTTTAPQRQAATFQACIDGGLNMPGGFTPTSSGLTPIGVAIACARAAVTPPIPYCNGGKVIGDSPPRCIDCSGLVEMAYKAAGINMSGDATTQYNRYKLLRDGRPMNTRGRDEYLLRPGDLLFFRYGGVPHIVMVVSVSPHQIQWISAASTTEKHEVSLTTTALPFGPINASHWVGTARP